MAPNRPLRRVLPLLVVAAVACGRREPPAETAAPAPETASSSAPLDAACPWGDDACPWPASPDAAPLLLEDTPTERRDVAVSWTMQGTASLASVRVEVRRTTASTGRLLVELRSDAATPTAGILLASGRLDVSELCEASASDCDAAAAAPRIPLAAATAASQASHGRKYWLRLRVERAAAAPVRVAVGVVAASHAAAGLARTVTGSSVLSPGATRFPVAAYQAASEGADVAFLPSLAPDQASSCRDGRRGGAESDVDCGVACGVGCGKAKRCRGSADCADDLFCRPVADKAAEESCTDAVCVCTTRLASGAPCLRARECAAGRCAPGPDGVARCEATSCGDSLRNGGETDVDCGGACAARCGETRQCSKDADCASGLLCRSGRCLRKAEDGATCKADGACRSGLCLLGRATAVCGAAQPSPEPCGRPAECASGVCKASRCAPPTAGDRVRNGDESDVDCGGTTAARCGIRKGCRVDGDCSGGLVCGAGGLCLKPEAAGCSAGGDCASGICATAGTVRSCRATPACDDGVRDGDETDVDCGGACAASGRRCAASKRCARGSDCRGGVCGADGTCAATSCTDGLRDGDEAGVDCGGSCPGCAAGVASLDAGGCASKLLGEDGRCAAPTCSDGVVNGGETGTDPSSGRECGGGCAPCPRGGGCLKSADCRLGICGTARRCAAPSNQPAGNACELDGDCASGLVCRCDAGRCETGRVGRCASAALCGNGAKDTAEADLDCGKACGRGCLDGKLCRTADDCSSGVCSSGKCAAPTAGDRVRNGSETAVDCGGASGRGCANGLRCAVDGDCASGSCDAGLGTCQPPTGPCGNGSGLSCGRACAARCGGGTSCRADVDCASLRCEGGVCAAAGCVIDGRRRADGAHNPSNPCEACVVGASTSAWTSSADGTACDDGRPDTTGDLCTAGRCSGTPNACLTDDLPCGRAAVVPEGLSCRLDGDCPTGERGAQSCVAGRCRGALCRLFPRAANGHVVCRPAGGPCDLPESCSASSPECPPDRLVEARTTCRASTAPCDAAERCDGAHAACPVDGLAPSGTTCRPSSVPCDAVETCDGVSPGCPVDRPMISGDACVSPATGPGVCVDADGPLVCSPLAACRIGGAWVREQARDATGCRVCLPARRAGAWSFLPDGTTCPGGTCDGGGTCETACDESPCPALAPRLDALTPDVVHARLETQVWVSGARLAGARATLVRPGVRVDLTRPLSRDGLLRVTVPEGLDAGDWDLEVAGTEGVSTLTGGLRVTAGPLTVTVLDVGQGDASLVHAPGGRTVLIDGGLFGMGRSRVDPRLSAPPDYVVSTHFDADHLAGLYEVLAGPDQLPNTADDVDPVIALLDHGDNRSCGSQLCERYLALRARLEAEGKARAIVPGEELDLGGGATVTCAFTNGVTGDGRRLFTAAENENSVGLVFGFAGFRYYSGGDVTGGAIEGCGAALSGGFEDVEGAAARFIGQVDAMKVSHHGSCTATPPAFAASVLPQVALNPAGLDNPFCHPADRVLANLAHVGADLLLTTPGMVTPGANGCSPTVRPTDRTAPVFGTLSLVVPGDGTFSASAFDGATTWSRSYTARAFEPLRESMPTTWPLPDGVTFVGRRGLQPVAGPIALNLPRVPPTDRAWLLPWALVDDALLVDVTRSVPVEGTVPATVTRLGKRLSVAPATALAAREAYALVLPGTTLGTSEPVVLPFLTGVDTSPGPAATLVSSVADAMNLAEVTVRFDRPVTGVTASSFFLEERLSGSDVVFGTVRAAQDGRTYTLEVPGSSRIGAGGVSCTGLCPSLPYAVRLTSDIRDAGGRPAEAALAPTFTSGSCVDTTAPTLTAATVRTFGGAATVSFQSDEPVAGVLRVVPSGGSFEACGSGAPDCVEVAVTGSCRTSACAPSAASCTQWAVVTGLTPGRSYDWSLAARDVTLRAAAPQTGGFTTVDAAVPVVTEVAADVPGTEELGEYVEVMNAGSQPLDLCALRLGRTSSELRVLCTVPATFVLEPGSRALLVGGSFCESGGTCTPTWTLPAGTGVLRTSSAKLFSAGIANATLPTVILQTTGAVSVSTVPGGGTCPEGQSRTRSSPYAPDVSGAFGCAASSPGTGP